MGIRKIGEVIDFEDLVMGDVVEFVGFEKEAHTWWKFEKYGHYNVKVDGDGDVCVKDNGGGMLSKSYDTFVFKLVKSGKGENMKEIKVGQKCRVVDAEGFGFSCIENGDVITIGAINDICGVVTEYRDLSNGVFMLDTDIVRGNVELISEPFDSITTQIPPVGTKCLYSFGGTCWWECEVIAQERPVIYCPHIDNIQVVDEEQCDVFYKPLPEEKPKSTAQIRMEEIEKRMRELADELRELSDE